jgi:hypothetical protein
MCTGHQIIQDLLMSEVDPIKRADSEPGVLTPRVVQRSELLHNDN